MMITVSRPSATVRILVGGNALVAVTLISLLAAAPTSAKAGPGTLDRSFGVDGRAMRAIPQASEGHVRFALAPGGKVIIQAGGIVLRYRQDGKLDRGFADRGQMRIEALPGTEFSPAGIAVDSQGRVLLAGTSTPSPRRPMWCGTPSLGGGTIPPSSATVFRFTPSGQRDQSFGEHGAVSTDLGLPPPTAGSALRCEAPVVRATGIAVDDEDRPVFTGQGAVEINTCKAGASWSTYDRTFVARLTGDGGLDPTFHETGARVDDSPNSAYAPAIDASGHILYLGVSAAACEFASSGYILGLGRLNARGQASPAAWPNGWKGLGHIQYGAEGFWFRETMAVDRLGRIALLQERYEPHALRVVRLRPNGQRDPRFGRRGAATLPLGPNTEFETIGVDRRGRILVAGSRTTRPCNGCDEIPGKGPISIFATLRMRSDGGGNRRFGHRGIALTGFGSDAKASAEQVLVDRRGRILVGGTVTSGHFASGIGFGLIRYLGGSRRRTP
jgi:uncharacterized delta-60 repeat protein